VPLFLGIDIGTQGVRVICCDQTGNVVAGGSHAFGPNVNVAQLPTGWSEQYPDIWWELVIASLADTLAGIKAAGYHLNDLSAISVDSTSGTILPVDINGIPLHPALMYNDSRATEEADLCNQAGQELCNALGFRFASSFALPKILWLLQNEPHIMAKAHKVIHAADYIVGKLTGNYTISDYSNALKTGYDLINLKWPDFIENKLAIDIALLPDIKRPGDVIGTVNRQCSVDTGLPEGCRVVAGLTDGSAGFLAAGASRVGEWNSTVGTTLVIRGVSERLIADPLGRLYCHLSPDGHWLPGGAGNVGGECLAKVFPGADYKSLDRNALELSPTGISVYPLVRKGERFPFVDTSAQGFVAGENIPNNILYTAYLEGVAFVERWCYELVESLGAPVGNVIYTTGGGAKSPEWMQIRADVMQRELVRPLVTESAMGAAIVAASRTYFSNCSEALTAMVKMDLRVSPRPGNKEAYESAYAAFRNECKLRGLGK
jgi:xylulokinase